MTENPIEFASDRPVDTKPPTEYGGTAGLIQSHVDHTPTPEELRGMIVRAVPAQKVDPLTGFLTWDEGVDATDPVSGRPVGAGVVDDGTAVAPADVPPVTEAP